MAVARLSVSPPAPSHVAPSNLSDEVELYQRTYSTLLRSSGETRLRVLESSHMAMGSSLHPLADSDEIDLGAFIYAVRRLPDSMIRDQDRRHGPGGGALPPRRASARSSSGRPSRRPARRRRWYDSGDEVLAVLLASESDVDDLVPTLVAYQIEWNKIRRRMLRRRLAAGGGARRPRRARRRSAARPTTGRGWPTRGASAFEERMQAIADEGKSMRLRMLGGTQVGYQRMTRRWWAPVRADLNERELGDAPLYFVSSNTHSLSNLVTGLAREREDELVAFVESAASTRTSRRSCARFREGRTEGSWENFLYFVARDFFDAGGPELRRKRHEAEVAAGVEHIRSKTALRVPAQVIPLANLDPARLDPRLGAVDADGPGPQRGGHRQHRLPARPGRLQPAARGGRRLGRPARRLRPGQGGDAQRRRRRRDDLDRSSTTSTRARPTGSTTPSPSTTSRPTSCSAPAWTTSAR